MGSSTLRKRLPVNGARGGIGFTKALMAADFHPREGWHERHGWPGAKQEEISFAP
jgi:hypothetical protein